MAIKEAVRRIEVKSAIKEHGMTRKKTRKHTEFFRVDFWRDTRIFGEGVALLVPLPAIYGRRDAAENLISAVFEKNIVIPFDKIVIYGI